MVKYIGEKDYEHGSREKVGILLTNLGTPNQPNTKALKLYLKEFLSDPRVIEVPKIIWQLILRIIILQLLKRYQKKNNYQKHQLLTAVTAEKIQKKFLIVSRKNYLFIEIYL